MKQDYIFFGEEGITSTSANFIANNAKEAYKPLEKKLENLRFYSEKIGTVSTPDTQTLKNGTKDLGFIEEYIKRIGNMNALIAWLREAIKAKDRLIKEVAASTYADYGIEVPVEPKMEASISSDEYISTWNIKKRFRYYYVKAMCSTYGDHIHPGDAIAQAREWLIDKMENPAFLSTNDYSAILHTFTPTVSLEEVDSKYMELQQTYREYQAELNSYNHEVQTAVENDALEKSAKYDREYAEYTAQVKKTEAALEKAKREARVGIYNLKIIIPDALKSSYEEISRLGKK